MMGNMYLRQLQFGYLDMAYHDNVVDVPDIEVFEDVVLGKTRLLPNVEGSTTSCSFSHIFAGGYAAGYYSYKWAEVLRLMPLKSLKMKEYSIRKLPPLSGRIFYLRVT